MFDYRHTMNNLACAEIKVSQSTNNNDNNISQLSSRLDFICFLFMYVYTFSIYSFLRDTGELFVVVYVCLSSYFPHNSFISLSQFLRCCCLERVSEREPKNKKIIILEELRGLKICLCVRVENKVKN